MFNIRKIQDSSRFSASVQSHYDSPDWYTNSGLAQYHHLRCTTCAVPPLLCTSCLSSWLTGPTLGKCKCNNVQLQMYKPTSSLTITSANYLYLYTEQLFRTRYQLIMFIGKWRFWVLTCKVFIHNEVFHNKFLLNTCTFLFNFLFSRSKFSFFSKSQNRHAKYVIIF